MGKVSNQLTKLPLQEAGVEEEHTNEKESQLAARHDSAYL